MLDFLLQARKAVIEEYPMLNWRANIGKKLIGRAKNLITDKGKEVGSLIYERHIPMVSDYVGEYTNVRGKNAESNMFSERGARDRGERGGPDG